MGLSIAGLIGLDSGETWQDRLQEAAYTSPVRGTRIRFQYEEVARVGTKRGAAFEFRGVDGAYIQQSGFGARRYPLRCIFSGDDNDRVATAFEAALYEPGIGTLESPRYGRIAVVPFGDISRRDDLVNEANQTIVEVTFWTSLQDVYPSPRNHPQSEIEAALGSFDVEAAQELAAAADLSTAVLRQNMAATMRGGLQDISAALRAASDTVSGARASFKRQTDLINDAMDVLVGQPLLLAQQIGNLIKAPASALSGIEERLAGYGRLAASVFGSDAGNPVISATSAPSENVKARNEFQAANLQAMYAAAGAVLAAVNTTYRTKPEALKAAASTTDLFDQVVDWRDAGFTTTQQIDPGGGYQALRSAVALTAGFLVQVSFTLAEERRVVLDRPRVIVELAAELYGRVDNDTLDLLIASNDLTGSEILELPRGREILYYP